MMYAWGSHPTRQSPHEYLTRRSFVNLLCARRPIAAPVTEQKNRPPVPVKCLTTLNERQKLRA